MKLSFSGNSHASNRIFPKWVKETSAAAEANTYMSLCRCRDIMLKQHNSIISRTTHTAKALNRFLYVSSAANASTVNTSVSNAAG